MCYSAMVEQNAKKIGLRFKARVQLDMYEELFDRRLKGEKLLINRAMESQFLGRSDSLEENRIADKILGWHAKQIPILTSEIFKQKKRLADANRANEAKLTKKSANEIRLSSKKLKLLMRDLEKYAPNMSISETDQRIYPLHYISMLMLCEQGSKIVMPVRYLMRPSNQEASFDIKYSGCYNARSDSLIKVPWWKDAVGKRHGLILVKKFYENVPTPKYLEKNPGVPSVSGKQNIVLCFEPDSVEYMFIPTLWDKWVSANGEAMYSCALITDEPAREVADAGHDRTPIFLKESAVDPWLKAKPTSETEIRSALSAREHPFYSHKIASAIA